MLSVDADPTATTAGGKTAGNLGAAYAEVAAVLEDAIQLSMSREGSREVFPNAQLVDAARKGNKENVRMLLAQKADPDSSER